MTTEIWRTLGPPQTWVVDMAFDPRDGTVYLGGDDDIGVFRGTGEPPWEKVLDDFCSWTVVVSRHDPDVVFAADSYGRGVRRSDDRGSTWTVVDGLPAWADRRGVVWDLCESPHDPAVVLAAVGGKNAHQTPTEGSGVWASADGGRTFSLLGLAGEDVQCVGVDPHDPDHILAGCGGRQPGPSLGLWHSWDGGATWDERVLDEASIVNVLADERAPGRWVAAIAGMGIFTSTDGGRTWAHGAGQEGLTFTWGVRRDPSNPSRLYSLVLLGAAGVAVSDDDGATWRATALTGKGCIGIGVSPSGSVFVGTYDEGLWRSDDGGDSWREVGGAMSHGYVYCGIHIDSRDRNRLVVPVHYGEMGGSGIRLSDDGGATWTRGETPDCKTAANAYQVAADPRDPDRLLSAFWNVGIGGGGLWQSTDGGRSWTVAGLDGTPCVSVAVDPRRPDVVWVGSTSGLHRSDDGGTTWDPAGVDGYVASVRFDPSDANHVVAATGGRGWGSNDPSGFWSSHDGGTTWSSVAAGAGRGAYDVAWGGDGRLWFAHEGGLSVSDDGGRTASVVIDRPADRATHVAVDPVDGAVYYAGSSYLALERGVVLRSTDGGASWEDVAADIRTGEVWWLTIDASDPADRRLYASTFGTGLCVRSIP